MTSVGSRRWQPVVQFTLLTFQLLFISAIMLKLITISLRCAALGWKLQVPLSGNNEIRTIQISILMHFNCNVTGGAPARTSANETLCKCGLLPASMCRGNTKQCL